MTAKKPRGSVYGYEVRDLYDSEDEFFAKNPSTTGMAAEDGRIILNPYSKLSDADKASVAVNEAARLFMRENNIEPDFEITEEQRKKFANTPYGKAGNEAFLKQTIAARIVANDSSAGQITKQQRAYAEKLRIQLESR